MLKSRKFVIWLATLIVFLVLVLKVENINIFDLGVALASISGIYMGTNVYQKKNSNEKN